MDNQVSLVTGASRGIGKAIAKKLAGDGHSLALFGRDTDKLKEVKDELQKDSNKVEIFSGDVADEEFVFGSVKKVIEQFGGVDHLINNAGVAYFKRFVDSNLDEFKRQIDTNLYGIYNFTKAVINHFIERKSGSVINISSLAGKNGFIGGTMYSATKHAVMGFSKSLMLEVRDHNIRVCTICPGSVATDLLIGTNMEPSKVEKILSPVDVAETVSTFIKLPSRANMSEIDIRPTNPK